MLCRIWERMFDNMDLNVDAYGIECKMNNDWTKVARWDVSNTQLVNTFRHYLCAYGTGLVYCRLRHVVVLDLLWLLLAALAKTCLC